MSDKANDKAREVLYDPAVRSTSDDPELALRCFKTIVEEFHTTIVATVDDEGLPKTSVIDMMDYDAEGMYFLTNVGKSFYERLVSRGFLSLSATNGKPTMECKAITLRGKVRETSPDRLARMMEKNPYMYELYPTEERRATLRAFQIYECSGSIYELDVKPPRQTFFEFK